MNATVPPASLTKERRPICVAAPPRTGFIWFPLIVDVSLRWRRTVLLQVAVGSTVQDSKGTTLECKADKKGKPRWTKK